MLFPRQPGGKAPYGFSPYYTQTQMQRQQFNLFKEDCWIGVFLLWLNRSENMLLCLQAKNILKLHLKIKPTKLKPYLWILKRNLVANKYYNSRF